MNKQQYNQNDLVQFTVAGDVTRLIYGVIVGKLSSHLIDTWLVKTAHLIKDYPYEVVALPHTFIKLRSDARPFLCEIGKLSHENE
jgi:hypothetical protein